MSEPTTATPPDNGAGAPAQPDGGQQQAAAMPQEPQQPQSQSPQTSDNDAYDFEAWLQQKNIDPATPEGRQAIAKSWRGLEQKMHQTATEASELRKSLTPQQQPQPQPQYDPSMGAQRSDPALQEFIQDYRRDKIISGFKESHQDWQQYEPKMAEILGQVAPSGHTYSQLVNGGVLDLEMIYAMAKSAGAEANQAQVQAEAQHQVLQTLANTQRAGGPNAQASGGVPSAPQVTKDNVESWYASLSAEERQKPENQEKLSSLLS